MAEKKVKDEKKEKGIGNGFKIIIIILLALILLGGTAFAGFFIFFKNNNTPVVNTNNINGTNIAPQMLIEEKAYDLGEFTVNLADEGGRRYLKAKISLGYDKSNKKLAKELEEESMKPILRDGVNTVLTSKKSTDITQKGKEDIKKEIMDKLNPLFRNGRVINVYFSEILVQ